MFEILPLKGGLDNVEGFFSDGINSGIKKKSIGQKQDGDLAFLRSETPCEVEALFTSNRFEAAPIKHFKRYGKSFKSNFVLINSKNANTLYGQRDIDDDIDEIFSHLPFEAINPIMGSTGVIGSLLDKKKIISALKTFNFNTKNSDDALRAILKTDRFKKEICFRVETKGKKAFHVAGICKGVGMIEPCLATMLCFIVTDAKVPKKDMKELLFEVSEQSFNAISVEGDISTNNTLMLLANGKSGSYDKEAFKETLKILTLNLALKIVQDGEGGSKVVSFEVKNAKTIHDAQKVAKSLSSSLLVKTTIHGKNPNWSIIASTIGASGIECDEKKLKIFYDDLLMYEYENFIHDKEKEKKASFIINKNSYKIVFDLGLGDKNFTAYGCDLGYKYIKINSNYRT